MSKPTKSTLETKILKWLKKYQPAISTMLMLVRTAADILMNNHRDSK